MKMNEQQFREHSSCYDGYCKHCDCITREGNTEPDAANYECPECGKMSCLGMDFAVVMGHLTIIED